MSDFSCVVTAGKFQSLQELNPSTLANPPMYLSFETLPNVRIQVSNFGGQVMEQPKNI